MKSFLIAVVLALVSTQAHALTRAEELAAQFKLNKASPNAMAQTKLGDRVIAGSYHTLRVKYDFAIEGGSVATVSLKDAVTGLPAVLPKGAIIRHCIIDTITQGATSASGTVALNAQSAGDLKAALAAASYTGLVACVPVGTAATAIKLTDDRTLTATVATGALTAGKFYVIIQYEMSDTE